MIEVAWPAAVGKRGTRLDGFALCRLPFRFGFDYFGECLIYQEQQSSDIPKTGLQARAGERIWSACRCSSCEWG